ncbi:MAG TPA: phosphatidylserine/phosphatidylglycerophosphate/cardiolipin synthase family protein [Thermoanaerobaculia bacterium]|nr:phosphatidylserine/phosphatidylglycerophosphate/cardiolipin synthase family protein [Thermoanaerobaculia bacterium]
MATSSLVRPARAVGLVLVAALLAGAAPARGDQVRVLDSVLEAAASRVEGVLGAKGEILTSTFIVGDDPFSLGALALLRDAARRGISVKLLVDSQWNKIPAAVQAHLVDEGIEIRTYHPFVWGNLHWLTRRLHDKLVIVDGEVLIAGGRNIESPYFGLGPAQVGRRNYLDCDVEVRGALAAEARTYFLALWESHHVKERKRPASAAAKAAAARQLDTYQAWLNARIEIARKDGVPLLDVPTPVEHLRFLHDPIGRKDPELGVGPELLARLDSAQVSITIESPYLIPTRAFRRGLARALERGVSVRILTNSLSTTDNLWAQAGYVGSKRRLVESGIDLWEYHGDESLHSKVAVIDGRWLIVGSFNLDPRSEYLNSEIAVEVDSPALVAIEEEIIATHLKSSWRIDERGFPEGSSERFPGVPKSKVRKLRWLKLLAPLIRSQL